MGLGQILIFAHEGDDLIPVIFIEMLLQPFGDFLCLTYISRIFTCS